MEFLDIFIIEADSMFISKEIQVRDFFYQDHRVIYENSLNLGSFQFKGNRFKLANESEEFWQFHLFLRKKRNCSSIPYIANIWDWVVVEFQPENIS
jgi:hypothetical protein